MELLIIGLFIGFGASQYYQYLCKKEKNTVEIECDFDGLSKDEIEKHVKDALLKACADLKNTSK